MENINKTILVVDDDSDYLFQMEHAVKSFGFTVKTAESQKEAEELIQDFKPDLAILDLMMESEDSGFILSYKIKKKYPDVPVIIVTAVGAETGLKFGVDEKMDQDWIKADMLLEKGIRHDQLHRDIVKLLKL